MFRPVLHASQDIRDLPDHPHRTRENGDREREGPSRDQAIERQATTRHVMPENEKVANYATD
jgi:hypothetical protein